jgi:peroxiredoxin
MPHTTLLPGESAPALSVPAIGGGQLTLETGKVTAVFFYRGVHCPLCKDQLEELAQRRGELAAIGVDSLAVSMDTEDRAARQGEEWNFGDLPVGYGLTEKSAREWGLYISEKTKEVEQHPFSEPAIMLLKADGTIFALWYQNVPFGRATFDALKKGFEFILSHDYPVRGKVPA